MQRGSGELEQFQAVRALFHQACELPRAERERFLADACRDADVRREVEALLAEDDGSTGSTAFERYARAVLHVASRAGAAPPPADAPAALPATIGKYRIIRRLGAGGMGTVFEAEQASPRRSVAVKVLRPEAATASLRKRFAHEAHILGQLAHPGIAQIIEAGCDAGPDGERMYLAMELIRGRNLIAYALDQGLATPQRLQLFIRVCEAVQHAHNKGVIHRDLKPANILVVEESSTPGAGDSGAAAIGQPKVLDFGVARLADDDAALTSVHTHAGQWIGTVPYMSPEQVGGDPQAVDTRSDVYALGVILYELLTGELPYAVRSLPVLAAAKVIREDEPQRLSAVNRGFRGDLETIVAKALEKDKERRYASAGELAGDLAAFASGLPIAAKRDSRFYLAQKTLRRYRLAVTLVSALLLLSGSAAVSLGVMYRRAEAARRHAEEAQAAADRQARRAQRIQDVLQDVVRAANVRALGPETRVVDALGYAEQGARRALGDEDATAAAVYLILAQTYSDLGRLDDAERNYRDAVRLCRALAPQGSVELGSVLNQYGAMLTNVSRFTEAEPLLLEAVTIHRRFSAEAPVDLAWALNNLGALYVNLRRLDEAEPLCREVLALRRGLDPDRPEHWSELAESLNQLCNICYQRKKLDEAAAAAEESIAIYRDRLDGLHEPNYPSTLANLGAIEVARQNFQRAGELQHAALDLIQQQRGPDHYMVSYALISVADFERRYGDAAQAEPLFRRAIAIRRKVHPPGHPELCYPLTALGTLLVGAGRMQEAELLLREAYATRIATAPTAFTTGMTMSALGRCLLGQQRYDEAEEILLPAYDVLRSGNETMPQVGTALRAIVELYERTQSPTLEAIWRTRLEAFEGAGQAALGTPL